MTLDEQLRAAILELGPKRALEILTSAQNSQSGDILTIISNEGAHLLPFTFRRGMVYAASSGKLDFSSSTRVHEQFDQILERLATLLKSLIWSKVYVVPFGHAALSMQIKLLVYRITRLETVDLFYDGKGGYFDLELELRQIIVRAVSEFSAIEGPLDGK
jgi:hypothetical protein